MSGFAQFAEENSARIDAVLARAENLGNPLLGEMSVDPAATVVVIDGKLNTPQANDPTLPLESADVMLATEQASSLADDIKRLTENARDWGGPGGIDSRLPVLALVAHGRATEYVLQPNHMRTHYIEYTEVAGRTDHRVPFAVGRLAVITATDDTVDKFSLGRYTIGDYEPTHFVDASTEPTENALGAQVDEFFDSPIIMDAMKETLAQALVTDDPEKNGQLLAQLRHSPMLPQHYHSLIDALVIDRMQYGDPEAAELEASLLDPSRFDEVENVLNQLQPASR